ncbi:MAG: FtsX-like permease family protein [Pirellulaceae bacterium]|nr:FtsX-like permease family protein [Pirellulaceae bacterium]
MVRTPLSTLNLLGKPTQALVSIMGVAFALLLIFMQLGFRGAVANTATVVYGKLDFDVVLRSPEYLHLYEARTIQHAWLDLLQSHPDIDSVSPFYIMLQKWQSPQDGNYRAIAMMGIRRDKLVIDNEEIRSQLDRLGNSDWVLIDRATRRDYGPKNRRRFGDEDIGLHAELGGQDIEIAGHFLLGTGLATNGAVLLSDVGFGKRSPYNVQQQTNLGLIKLKPGVQPEQAAANINAWLRDRDERAGSTVEALSRKQAIDWEHRRWLGETPIGIIFQLGVGLAFIVGAAIVYMVLASDVANRLPEYATLKAMGYSSLFVANVVIRQAWLLAIFGYIPAVAMAAGLYYITASLAGIPIYMTWERAIGIGILGIAMCTFSGGLAIRKLWKAEPAELF